MEDAFEELRRFLNSEEHTQTRKIGEVEKNAIQKREERMDELFQEFSSCDKMMRELQKKCGQQPNNLLQETAHPLLILSKDCKSVSLGNEAPCFAKTHKRFDTSHSVLGCEEFKEGRSYWDISMGKDGDWTVGVARKSVRRKNAISIEPRSGIWAIGKRGNDYFAFDAPNCSRLQPIGELRRIRIFFNYAGKHVAMELQHIVQKLRRELTCSICFKSFLNPTTLACGHNFCHACLVSYWGQFPIETACPRCQEKISRLNFIPNVQLANITKLVEELSVDIKQITAGGHVCLKHPPTLQAFCRNELVLFCSRCDLSQEHLTHDVVPVAEAAREYKLILSEDLKSCWLGRKNQNLVNDDKRFDLMTCVLGREMFVAGRHYWDVAVENEGDWGVGVARSSMKRKGIEAFRNMEGIWAMAKCCGRFWVYMNPPALVSEPMRWKIKKIRVSLNYAGGRKLESEITCFVCSEYLIQPVTLDCGHNFCHACIVKCWAQISDATACPQCRVAVPRLNFKPNGQLANAVQLIRQLSDQAKQMARRSKTCQGHEPAMSFCKDDLVPICVHCDGSQEHETHDDQFLSCIESLRKEKEQLLEAEKKKVMDGFNHLCQLVLEQSTFWLTKVEEVKTEITLKTNDQMAVISKELFVLDYIIQDMVEKCDQPVLEFLEVRNLGHYKKKKKFENPVVFPPEIKHEIWGLQDFSAFLPGAMKQFKANCSICGQYFKDPVILDCGHIFCRDCILRFQCWKESSPELACPQCQLQNFSQNQQLDNIRLLKQLRDQAEGDSKCCQQHQEHLELFCKNDQVFVCSVCHGSEEHQDVFGNPVIFPLGLKWEIWDLCDLRIVLKNAMMQFKDTAHPKLIISENRKNLILGNWPRLHSHCSKRFDQCLFVLGCEKFNTGRCYWEVTVGSEDGWGLGVAKASVKRKGIVSLDPGEGIWAMAKWGDHCTVLLPPDFPTLLMKWDLQRIRISLNYIGGRLSFFDADRGILLVVFSGASFSEEPLHPFFWLQRKGQLILCH
ncbi:Zinc finger protein RFP, partial [Ophiophagus hannah]